MARYDTLGRWAQTKGLSAIVTAHHADDQAETLLMRLSRGAGLRGLAAIRGRSRVPGWPGCALLRPLLRWRRSELAGIVMSAGILPAIDPSNSDQRFERARVRQMLAALPTLDSTAVAASAAHLAEADVAIEWATERCLATAELRDGVLYWSPSDTPRVLALRVLERIVASFGGGTPRGNALACWHDRLASGEIATLAGVRGDGRRTEWSFALAAVPRCRSPSDIESP